MQGLLTSLKDDLIIKITSKMKNIDQKGSKKIIKNNLVLVYWRYV